MRFHKLFGQFMLTESSSEVLNKEEKHKKHIILVKHDIEINSSRFFFSVLTTSNSKLNSTS